MDFVTITLQTSNLAAVQDFYVNHLGFKLVKSKPDEIVIKIGRSHLAFVPSTIDKPFYHYAFTIAGNQFEAAKKFFKSKVTLSTANKKDEVYFPFLDASSFYFHDPADNVVEIIARHSIFKDSNGFLIDDIECISEINLTVHDVLLQGEKLINHGLNTLSEEPIKEESLNFLGEKDAYFLLGPRGRKWFFSHKIADVFPVTVELGNEKKVTLNKEGVVDFK